MTAIDSYGFHNHLLKIAWIRYSFRYRKTPHFLVQVLYHTCLTNGVHITGGPVFTFPFLTTRFEVYHEPFVFALKDDSRF